MERTQKMKTLRLLFPQWQGGFDETEFPGQVYPLGARLLAWLAPNSDAPLVEARSRSAQGLEPQRKAAFSIGRRSWARCVPQEKSSMPICRIA